MTDPIDLPRQEVTSEQSAIFADVWFERSMQLYDGYEPLDRSGIGAPLGRQANRIGGQKAAIEAAAAA